MTEWQPIETAPRDGTQILVSVASEYEADRSTLHLVTWAKGYTHPDPRIPDEPACWSANENGARYHEPYVQKWMPAPSKVQLQPVPIRKPNDFRAYGFTGAAA